MVYNLNSFTKVVAFGSWTLFSFYSPSPTIPFIHHKAITQCANTEPTHSYFTAFTPTYSVPPSKMPR